MEEVKEETNEEVEETTEEESELEEELEEMEENPEPSQASFQNFMVPIKSGAPVLDKVAEAPDTTMTLERGVEEFMPSGKKEDDEKKYDSPVDISSQYEEGSKKNNEYKISSDQEVQFSQPSARVDMQTVGRGSTTIGHEAGLVHSDELMKAQESIKKDYESLSGITGKDEFQGQKTGFQEDLEKRYSFDK